MAYKRKKEYTAEEKKKFQEERKQKMKELEETLENGIRAFSDSEQYKGWLKTMSKFHNYSFSNSILIYLQNPQANYVASFANWKKNFNRTVKAGEKGIKIYVPMIYKEKKTIEKNTDDKNLEKNNENEEKTVNVPYISYKIGYVFGDNQVEQIQGKKEIPLDLMNELQDKNHVQNFEKIKSALIKTAQIPVTFENIDGGAKGYYMPSDIPSDEKIAIQKGMSEAQTLKTLVHEIAHSKLHNLDNIKALKEKGIKFTRNDKETQAESVAFVVCNAFGLDTSDYSFPYLTAWTNGDIKFVEENFKYIREAAHTILDSVEKELEANKEIENEKNKDTSFEKEESIKYQNAKTEQTVVPVQTHTALGRMKMAKQNQSAVKKEIEK